MSSSVFGSRHVRALQRWAMGKARRSRFFPVTIPDRLGDDDRLAGATLPHSVMVFFPDTQESLYQIRPWLRAFEALDDVERTVIVCQDSRTAQRLREESTLDVITVARYGRMDDLLSRGNLRLALYVNHSPRNFENLRFTSLTHVYLGHGDSDKGVSASNQVKAYDFCFVAGQAAVDRLAAYVPRYDAEARCRTIGQPQLDSSGLLTLPPRPESGRTTVLYAPTWEGAQPSVAYSSVVSHGRTLVRALLDDGSFDVIYRPHPLTGVTSGEYGAADAEIRAMVTDSAGAHRVDTHPDLHEGFAAADFLVCDVSGVALSWLPTGRPMIVTETDAAPATAGDSLTLGAERLVAQEAGSLPARARALLQDAGYDDRMRTLRNHYFLTTDAGAATRNFVAECRSLAGAPADGRTDVVGGASE